jgi:fluoride ion exporter CrcB/FEX
VWIRWLCCGGNEDRSRIGIFGSYLRLLSRSVVRAQPFTLGQAYTNVSISALLSRFAGAEDVNPSYQQAYLTTSIGPGASSPLASVSLTHSNDLPQTDQLPQQCDLSGMSRELDTQLPRLDLRLARPSWTRGLGLATRADTLQANISGDAAAALLVGSLRRR